MFESSPHNPGCPALTTSQADRLAARIRAGSNTCKSRTIMQVAVMVGRPGAPGWRASSPRRIQQPVQVLVPMRRAQRNTQPGSPPPERLAALWRAPRCRHDAATPSSTSPPNCRPIIKGWIGGGRSQQGPLKAGQARGDSSNQGRKMHAPPGFRFDHVQRPQLASAASSGGAGRGEHVGAGPLKNPFDHVGVCCHERGPNTPAALPNVPT